MGKRTITAITAIYVAIFTLLCLIKVSVPTPDLEVIGFDKLIHCGIYFGFNTLLIIKCRVYGWLSGGIPTALTTSIIAILYGVVIEVIQSLVGRDFDIYDIAANTTGAILAAFIISSNWAQRVISRYFNTEG